ncbi:MAG: TolC family protein [Nitrospirae bacterium]|nr:TolC family protein [Nitrospirota bacterium]
MNNPETYIIRIYRREKRETEKIIGTVEDIGDNPEKRKFGNMEDLCEILSKGSEIKKEKENLPMRICLFFILLLFVMDTSVIFSQETELLPLKNQDAAHNNLTAENLKLSLKDAILFALQNNFELKIVKLDTLSSGADIQKEEGIYDPFFSIGATAKQSKEKIDSRTAASLGDFAADADAKSSDKGIKTSLEKRFPTGTAASLSYEHSENTQGITASAFNVKNPDLYKSSVKLQLEQSLLKNLGADIGTAKIQVARKKSEIASSVYEGGIVDLIYQVQIAYWDLVEAIEALKVRRQSVSLAKEVLSKKQLEVTLGAFPSIYLIEIEADIIARESDVIQAEKVLQEIESRFKKIARMPLESQIELQQRIVPTEGLEFKEQQFDYGNSLEQALKNRQDYLSAIHNITVQKTISSFTENQILPDLRLSTSLSFNNPDTTYLPFNRSDRHVWEIGITLSVPLDNNTAMAEHTKAALELEKNKLALQQKAHDIKNELITAINDVDNNIKIVESSGKSVAFQEKSLDAEWKKLQSGISKISDYIYKQNLLIQTKMLHISNNISYQKSIAALYKAMGIIPPRFGIEAEKDKQGGSNG